MTLLSTIPRRPGFIAHQSGERLVEGAELELPLAAGAEALVYIQKKTRTQGFRGERLAEDAGDAEVRTPSCPGFSQL